MMDPAKNIIEGANKDLFAVGTGVIITDKDGSGIAFCPFDHPLISLDRPGIWKFIKDFIPQKPVIYLNLYNNQWSTNYRYWYPGTWSSKVRIWTFTNNSTVESRLITPSLEVRTPLLVADANGKGGSLPLSQNGITLSRKGIQVTTFGPDFNGNKGTLLRVWEQGGISGEPTVTLPPDKKFATTLPINLRSQKTGEPIIITRGMLSFKLHVYAPAGFILKE